MKNTTATETAHSAAKELGDALSNFNSILTRNWVEAQTRNWEEMVRLGETTTKIAMDVCKDVPFFKNLNPFNGFWNK